MQLPRSPDPVSTPTLASELTSTYTPTPEPAPTPTFASYLLLLLLTPSARTSEMFSLLDLTQDSVLDSRDLAAVSREGIKELLGRMVREPQEQGKDEEY